jgi:hypothetical protein
MSTNYVKEFIDGKAPGCCCSKLPQCTEIPEIVSLTSSATRIVQAKVYDYINRRLCFKFNNRL